MITKFARLEFELFTKPSKLDFLRVHQILTKNKKGRAFNFSALFFTEKCPNLHPKDYSYIERFDVAISVRNLHFSIIEDLGNESSIPNYT